MDSRTENPTKAAGYLKELNKIIATQQTLLERQKRRIFELEQHVSDLCAENSRLRHEYQRHLLSCRLRSIQENSPLQQSEYGSTRIVRRHASLPVETTDSPSSLRSAVCKRTVPNRQWKSASFGCVNALHQYCCPAPLCSKQLAVPAPLSECRDDSVLHQFCCPPSGSSSPSR
ncbi:IQ motif and SEC7 domain-containing protein 3-like isoform X1 [Sinocyclocheilus anshuiensis]|uniref:IQ motif and SEC7 domain-containing protein 3-like isoform X1 n=1 Tax=Sinocyclocheilus anshuiensis TaxID=1608454 RepID=UPI0007BA8AF7|nr:PREDICTED: IQ motif and SEC7 domain-containing protein 3-like isoform X1 [Sinocyclocheilus anshuiensis]